ncbi:hypothetical protein [Amycolatopsis ultiminotia]
MDAFIGWLHAMTAHIATYLGLKALLATAFRDDHGGLNSWCHEVMLEAANSVLRPGQEAGDVKEEAGALLSLMIDGLRTR